MDSKFSTDTKDEEAIESFYFTTLSGESQVEFVKNKVVIKVLNTGKIHFITRDFYNLFTLTSAESVIQTGITVKPIKEKNIEILPINTFETLFTNDFSFPIRLAFTLDNFKGGFTQNYKVDYQLMVNDNKYQDIKVTAYFTDSTFSVKDTSNIIIKDLKFQKTIMVYGNVEENKYSYLYVEITPKGDFSELSNVFWGLQITSNIEPFSYKFQTLGPKKYFYGTLDNSTNSYSFILKGIETNNFMNIEFASCSNDTYEIEFYKEDEDITIRIKLNFTSEENSGRTLFTINEIESSYYVNMTITRTKSSEFNKDLSFFIVKYTYSNKYSSYQKFTVSSPIEAEYSSSNNSISLSWGGMHDQGDNYVSPKFYVSFYDREIVKATQKSICSMFNSHYNETVFKNVSTWNNVDNIEFKFEISAIGYYVNEETEEEYLISFGSVMKEGGA